MQSQDERFVPEESGSQPYLNVLFHASTYLLHAGLFVGGTLIGIARYSRDAPPLILAFMAVWSVALLLHGIGVWRRQAMLPAGANGVSRTVVLASALNAVMWVMWMLATDARDSTPLHLSVWIALVAGTVSALIGGKRILYAHWLREFMRENPAYLRDRYGDESETR
ncbi:MAG: hypothetical protein IPK19_22105 [Chloroflexi bacterium]|nr:hypothetical protein [Chloroflexota bacterium]